MDQPKLGLVKETDPPDKLGAGINDEGYDGGALLIDRRDLEGVDVEEIEEDVEEEEGNEDDENVNNEADGRGQGSDADPDDDYEEAEASENDEEEEGSIIKAFEFETCLECKDECSRPVKELCGHVKCRDCFIGSGDGCMQCFKAGRIERKRSNSALGLDDEEYEEEPADFFFDENDDEHEGDESEAEVETPLENGKLVVKPDEYVFELGEVSGTKSLAVVSKETLIGLGINPDGNELHQEPPNENNQPNNHTESSAEVIVPDINLPDNDTNIPPEEASVLKSEPAEDDIEAEPTMSPPPSPPPSTQPPSQIVPTDTNTKEKVRRGKRRSVKEMITDHIVEIEVVDTTPSPIIGPDMNPTITRWKCLKCDQEFSQEYRRKYHFYCDPSNGKRPFPCGHCADEFVSQSHYQYHVRSQHTGEKPYKCPICDQRFIQKVKLNRHMTTHSTKPKPNISAAYLCAYCKKRFNSLQSCRRHIKVHTEQSDEKPFACDICQKSFKQKYAMQNHRKIHKNERPHKCPQCDKGFSTAKDMRRHFLIHTGELPFQCGVCSIKFRRKDNLERHIKTTHGLSERIAKVFGKEAVREYKKKKENEMLNNSDS